METLLEGLNEEQRQAVEHGEGPMLVVAGAGTGKTQVITRRIARLIESGEAKPTEVLVLTFTEKAAQEMSDRLMGLIGWQAASVPVRTFNAFGSELMLDFAHHIGRSIRGGLLNETQKSLLLKQRILDLELEYYPLQQDLYEFSERIVGYIGRLQNLGISLERYRAFVEGLAPNEHGWSTADIAEQRDLLKLFQAYESLKLETRTYDYHDQLAMPLAILADRPHLIERLRKRYRYVLVDEYQDTSPIQDTLLRLLIPVGGNIFAVGDDDQAIYAFRGAEMANIMAFRDHFGVQAPIALIQNYRSGQPILDAAHRLIRHNDPDRLEAMLGIDKRLLAQERSAEVRYRTYADAAEEEASVVAEIKQRVDGGEVAGQFAILARSNAVLRRYAKRLSGEGIPYSISTTISVFEQREMINLWSLMEWTACKASDDAISAVIMGPFFGWSAADLRHVVDRARSENCTLEAALRHEAEAGFEPAVRLLERLDRLRELAASESIGRFVIRAFGESDFAQRLLDRAGEARPYKVFQDLQRFATHLADYESTQVLQSIGDLSLTTYLNQFPQPPELEISEREGQGNGVQLLTIHASKGLEFPVVYVVSVTLRGWGSQPAGGLQVPEELLPPAKDEADLHEQRRLMYVAVTRAKNELYVSAANATANGSRQSISPLLLELAGEDKIEAIPPQAKKDLNSLLEVQRLFPLAAQSPDRLPFETDDGWIELAVGDLDRYERQPHDFYLQNVLGIVRPFGPQLGFGTAVHGAIQAFYDAQMQGRHLTSEELLLRLDELWDDRGYETEAQALKARERARAALLRFRERELSDHKPVQATELPVQLEVPEAKLRLRGRLDLTIDHPDGLEIRDFKTGNVSDPEKLLALTKKSFQLRTYALAIEALSGTPPKLVTLDYVMTGTTASTELSPTILRNHRQKLITLADGIRRREFDPGAPSSYNASSAFRYYGTESEDDEVDLAAEATDA